MMKTSHCMVMCVFFFGFFSCKENKPAKSDPILPTPVSEEKPGTSSDFLLLESTAGPFEIGDKIPRNLENYQIQKTEQTRHTEEGPVEETVYILSQNGKEHLLLKPEFQKGSNAGGQTVTEIIVLSEKYKTTENIGVGSSLEDFAMAYPSHKIWYTYVSDRYVVENPTSSLQFLLDENDFKGKIEINSAKIPLKKADFSKNAAIKKIRLYQ